jgi:hypothetical protein
MRVAILGASFMGGVRCAPTGKAPSRVTADDAVRALRVALAARASIEQGRVAVRLD